MKLWLLLAVAQAWAPSVLPCSCRDYLTEAEKLCAAKFAYHKAIAKAAPKAGITFGDFCERIQVHGLLDWYQATSFTAKCFWLTFIVIFAVILTMEIRQAVGEFYTNPIKTSISVMPADTVDIPDIYICPLNYIDNEKIERENLGETRDILWPYLTRPRVANLFSKIQQKWKEESPLMAIDGEVSESRFRQVLNATALRENILSISFNASEIVRFCEFQGIEIDCSGMVTPIVDKDYGLCYRMVSNLTQSMPGAGLKMLIDIHADNYMIDNIDAFYQGAILRFGDDAKPFTLGGYLAGPGRYVKYGLEKVHEKLITITTSKTPQICQEDEVRFKFIKTKYSKLACAVDCLVELTHSKCKCLPKMDPMFLHEEWHGTPVCNVSVITKCFLPIILSENHRQTCIKGCYRQCEDSTYKVHESSMLLGTPQLIEYFDLIGQSGDEATLPNFARPEYWQKSIILIEVAFDRMEVMSVVQSPAATATDLIGSLGGQAGLWLGASMFTLIQVITLLVSWCYTKVTRKKEEDAGVKVETEKKLSGLIVKF